MLCCRVSLVYKIVNGLVAIPVAPYIQQQTSSTRGHDLKFQIAYTTVNTYKYGFFPATGMSWYTLPYSAVAAPSLECFQHRVSTVQLPGYIAETPSPAFKIDFSDSCF